MPRLASGRRVGAEDAGDHRHQRRGHEERAGVDEERQRERDEQQQRAERRTDERVGDRSRCSTSARWPSRAGRRARGWAGSSAPSCRAAPRPCRAAASPATTRRYRPVRVPVTESTSSGPGSESCWPSTAKRDAQREQRRAARPSRTIARRRSTRSVITPAGSVKTSHGRRWATITSAIRIGLRVTADASHG